MLKNLSSQFPRLRAPLLPLAPMAGDTQSVQWRNRPCRVMGSVGSNSPLLLLPSYSSPVLQCGSSMGHSPSGDVPAQSWSTFSPLTLLFSHSISSWKPPLQPLPFQNLNTDTQHSVFITKIYMLYIVTLWTAFTFLFSFFSIWKRQNPLFLFWLVRLRFSILCCIE